MDIKGKRAQKKPWVIHDESRSGKSHLARRIFCEFNSMQGKRIKLIVPAREKLEARNVMRILFEKMRYEYENRAHSVLLEDESAKGLCSLTDVLVERVAHFLSEPTENLTISLNKTQTRALEAGQIFARFGRDSP